MNKFLTKIKFISKKYDKKEVKFNVIKILETETFLQKEVIRKDSEITYSKFIGEASQDKEFLLRLISERNVEIVDSSYKRHEGIFTYFKPIRNNEYEICFEIKRILK